MTAFLVHLRALTDFLFPLECIACAVPGVYCCASCLSKVPLLTRAAAIDGPDLAYAVAAYGHPLVRQVVRDLKFQHRTAALEAVQGLVARWSLVHGAALPVRGAVICHVPLHVSRTRERGYDQAERIARVFAGELAIPRFEALMRVKRTSPQTGTRDRAENVRGAFAAAGRAPVAGRTCVLVDDVVTSGATMRACTETLRAAGAKRVIGLAFASGFTKDENSPTV